MGIYTKHQKPEFELLIWKIEESFDFFIEELNLSPEQLLAQRLHYKSDLSFSQWLASRYNLQLLFQKPYNHFKKNTQGKLELINHNEQLSISHSGNYVSVCKSIQAIGVDIQIPNIKLERIAKKYIDLSLLNQLKSSPHYIDYLHYYWGIKEALFKAYGLGQLKYIQHLHIQAFKYSTRGYTKAQIIKGNFKASYKVFFEKTEDYYLCLVTKI